MVRQSEAGQIFLNNRITCILKPRERNYSL